MRSPGNAERRPGQDGATSAQQAPRDENRGQRTPTTQVPVAFATKYLAAGGAHYDWLLVRKCPLCGHAHRHIRFEVGDLVVQRAPGCARHRVYTVQITDVVPSASGCRIRGAA